MCVKKENFSICLPTHTPSILRGPGVPAPPSHTRSEVEVGVSKQRKTRLRCSFDSSGSVLCPPLFFLFRKDSTYIKHYNHYVNMDEFINKRVTADPSVSLHPYGDILSQVGFLTFFLSQGFILSIDILKQFLENCTDTDLLQ